MEKGYGEIKLLINSSKNLVDFFFIKLKIAIDIILCIYDLSTL